MLQLERMAENGKKKQIFSLAVKIMKFGFLWFVFCSVIPNL